MRSSTLIHYMDDFGQDIRIVLKYLAIYERNTVTFTIVDPNGKLLVENIVRMTDSGTFILQSTFSDGNKTEGTQGSLSLDMLKGIISYAKATTSTHSKYATVWNATKWDEMLWEIEQYEQLYEE